MANENRNEATGFKYEPMPPTMNDERAERLTREKVTRLLSSINNYIMKFRENGVTIESEDELRQLTPTAIRDQIAQTRKRRLGEKFLPPAIRKAEEREFNNMERVLVPLAENLQETLKSISFDIHIGAGTEETYFDGNQTEDYIEQTATVTIPEDICNYYQEIQQVCEAWYNFRKWCIENHFDQPSVSLLHKLYDGGRLDHDTPEHLQQCVFSLSPEQMFNLWQYGIIRQLPSET